MPPLIPGADAGRIDVIILNLALTTIKNFVGSWAKEVDANSRPLIIRTRRSSGNLLISFKDLLLFSHTQPSNPLQSAAQEKGMEDHANQAEEQAVVQAEAEQEVATVRADETVTDDATRTGAICVWVCVCLACQKCGLMQRAIVVHTTGRSLP